MADRHERGSLRGVLDGFDWMGASIAFAGAVCLIVAFSVLDWMRTDDFGLSRHGPVAFHYRGIHKLLTVVPAFRPRFATAYFSWLGIVFLVLALIAVVVANLSVPVRWAVRLGGVVVAVFGFVLTLMSLPDVNQWGHLLAHPGESGGAWSHMGAQMGWYLAMLGFVLVGVGSAAGSWKTDPEWANTHQAPDPYADQRTGDYVTVEENYSPEDDTQGEAGGAADSEHRAGDSVYVPVSVGSEGSSAASRSDVPTPPEGTPPAR